jgi:type III pantothenate kinase
MLLTIDIGNTNIHNGIFSGRALKKAFKIPAYTKGLRPEYIKKLGTYLYRIKRIVIVSVVPGELTRLERLVRDITNAKIFVVGRDIDSGVKNLYKDPKQVGQDRLVNARAAYELYGGACMVVDFGTAITVDVVNEKKEYLGGVIAPGVEVSLTALSARAILLPKIKIKKPCAILGRDTRQSMMSGAVYGFSSLCDGIVEKLKKKYCRKARVIGTGGMSQLIGPYCKSVETIDPFLTLKGLKLIGDKNRV